MICGILIGTRAARTAHDSDIAGALSSLEHQLNTEHEAQIKELRDIITLLEWDNDMLNTEIRARTEALQQSHDLTIALTKVWNTRSSIGISDEEMDLFLRCVEAEAGNQSVEGRLAVANVILNQINSEHYKDTITDVIYDRAPSGAYHFSVVFDNRINEVTPSYLTRVAVSRALAGESNVDGNVLAFATPNIDFSDWCVPSVLIGDIQFWIPKITQIEKR